MKFIYVNVIEKLLPYLAPVTAFIFGGFFLKDWKKRRSENKKHEYNNRADTAENFLDRLERLSIKASNYHESKEDARSDILKMIRLAEAHFEVCKEPKDDFFRYINTLENKYKNNV